MKTYFDSYLKYKKKYLHLSSQMSNTSTTDFENLHAELLNKGSGRHKIETSVEKNNVPFNYNSCVHYVHSERNGVLDISFVKNAYALRGEEYNKTIHTGQLELMEIIKRKKKDLPYLKYLLLHLGKVGTHENTKDSMNINILFENYPKDIFEKHDFSNSNTFTVLTWNLDSQFGMADVKRRCQTSYKRPCSNKELKKFINSYLYSKLRLYYESLLIINIAFRLQKPQKFNIKTLIFYENAPEITNYFPEIGETRHIQTIRPETDNPWIQPFLPQLHLQDNNYWAFMKSNESVNLPHIKKKYKKSLKGAFKDYFTFMLIFYGGLVEASDEERKSYKYYGDLMNQNIKGVFKLKGSSAFSLDLDQIRINNMRSDITDKLKQNQKVKKNVEINIRDLRFTQLMAGSGGEGYSVFDNAKVMRKTLRLLADGDESKFDINQPYLLPTGYVDTTGMVGRLEPKGIRLVTLPKCEAFEVDGRYYSLDHRRLISTILSGYSGNILVDIHNVRANSKGQWFKISPTLSKTEDEGKSIYISDSGLHIEVVNSDRPLVTIKESVVSMASELTLEELRWNLFSYPESSKKFLHEYLMGLETPIVQLQFEFAQDSENLCKGLRVRCGEILCSEDFNTYVDDICKSFSRNVPVDLYYSKVHPAMDLILKEFYLPNSKLTTFNVVSIELADFPPGDFWKDITKISMSIKMRNHIELSKQITIDRPQTWIKGVSKKLNPHYRMHASSKPRAQGFQKRPCEQLPLSVCPIRDCMVRSSKRQNIVCTESTKPLVIKVKIDSKKVKDFIELISNYFNLTDYEAYISRNGTDLNILKILPSKIISGEESLLLEWEYPQ
jgi:hypothetical protein